MLSHLNSQDGPAMTLSNIYPQYLKQNADGLLPKQTSVTILNPEGPGWAFAETSIAGLSGSGIANAWISATRRRTSPDQVLVGIDETPGGPFDSARWIPDCLSVTFSLSVWSQSAYATCKLSTWVAR
jgi:hypothetical protein